MKRLTWILPVLAAVMFFGTGCDELIDPTKPTVLATVLQDGDGLRLSWTVVPGVDGYKVKYGDSTVTTTQTTYDVLTPVKRIEVRSYTGSAESEAWVLDCTVVETASLAVYGISDPSPDHPSAFGFNADGTITTYSVNQTNYPAIDFYMEDVQLPGMNVVNPGDRGWNAKGNAAKASGSTNYAGITIADAPGSGYLTQQELAVGGVFYLWLDRTNNNWDVSDNFAKAKVISIQGAAVTMMVGYQKVAGLRWLVN